MSGVRGVLRAAAVGVPLPLCSCAVIPVGIGMKRQGAGDGASVAFLISTPQTGVDSVLVTASMLGWPLALFKLAAALVMGVIGGLVSEATAPRRITLPIIDLPNTQEKVPWWLAALRHADELLRSVWRWLLVGVLASALLSSFLPADLFGRLASYGPLAAMGVALGVSLPLYVCATASVPIAAALVEGGLPLGAVLVFLMAGPATNAATIGAVYRGLGMRPLVIYLLTILVGSIAGGLVFEGFLGSSGGSVSVAHHSHDHRMASAAWWSVACAVLLLLIVCRYAWSDMRRLLAKKDSAA